MRPSVFALSLALAVCFPLTVGAEELGASYSEARLNAFLKGQPEFISPVVAPSNQRGVTCCPDHDRTGCRGWPDLRPFMKRFQELVAARCGKTVILKTASTSQKTYPTVLSFKYTSDGRIRKPRIARPSPLPEVDAELLNIFSSLPRCEALPEGLAVDDVDIEFTVNSSGLRNPGARSGPPASESDDTAGGTITGHIVRFKPNPAVAAANATPSPSASAANQQTSDPPNFIP